MYKIYKSQTVIDNHEEFVKDCGTIFKSIAKNLKTVDTTWAYGQYNIFSYASPIAIRLILSF